MKRLVVGKLSLALVGAAACGFAGLVLGMSQATPSGPSAPAGPRPLLGFDDSSTPDPALPPTLGFDDSAAPPPPQGPGADQAQSARPADPRPVPGPPALAGLWGGPDEDPLPVWFAGDALLWWIRDSRFPPLVTTSPQTSLGILGQPGTQVLFGGHVENEERMGGRFRAGLWLDEDQVWGAESAFLFLGERSIRFAAASPGEPLLARPFFDVFTGQEGADEVANLGPPFLPLLPLAGRITVTAPSRLWGAEANAVRRLAADGSSSIDLLAGFRYLRLDEGLDIREDLMVPGGAPVAAGTQFMLDDNFGTRNHFYGGQLGTRATWERGAWSLELLGKVGLGVTQQLADVRGNTRITVPGVGTETFNGALLALPTNSGRYTRDRFAVLPEAGVTVGYRITAGLRATVGYSFLEWSSVARPGDQVDRAVNPTQLPPSTLRGPAQPAFTFHGTSFWAQGANFGLEYQY